jgi:hypothetical protein
MKIYQENSRKKFLGLRKNPRKCFSFNNADNLEYDACFAQCSICEEIRHAYLLFISNTFGFADF